MKNKNFIRRFSGLRAFETHLPNQKTKFGRDAELFKRDESATQESERPNNVMNFKDRDRMKGSAGLDVDFVSPREEGIDINHYLCSNVNFHVFEKHKK